MDFDDCEVKFLDAISYEIHTRNGWPYTDVTQNSNEEIMQNHTMGALRDIKLSSESLIRGQCKHSY